MSRITRTGAALVVALLLTACGGGGADEVPAGQCYIAGQASDCTAPSVTVQPVQCSASAGACS